MNLNNKSERMLIADEEAALRFLESAKNHDAFALDTEFMRVRTYFAELCLVQVALRDGRAACIDPLELRPEKLGASLADLPGVLVVHSAGQDLEVLDSSLGYLPPIIFDTQIAAAMLGYGEQISYSNLARQLLGVELAKGETRTDWCRRPLTDAQLDYAFADVEHLLDMHDLLAADLERSGKSKWVAHACAELVGRRPQEDDGLVVARFKGGAGVPVARQGLLRKLVLWREQVAREKNRPREWVVSSADLIAIALKAPDTGAKLANATSLNAAQLRKYADPLTSLVEESRGEESTESVWLPRTDLDSEQKANLKRMQKRVRDFCEDMSISPAALVSRADLEALLTGRPGRLDSGWRRELIGDVLEDLL